MKVPRDISASKLIKILSNYGYSKTRQSGSHIRLTIIIEEKSFHVTIPNHDPIKIGTLNSILNDVSKQLNLNKQTLINDLF
ncbi:MAG: type II toxin-antitoxin system HicA family toxin [bacterium]|nr:type II toxin-antitoxin system HicA family toxin [bacterium]